MKIQAGSVAVSLERRKQLLRGIQGFAGLPEALLTDLAGGLREEQYARDAVVVAEGDIGDRLFLIEEGQAEVSTAGAMSTVSLGVLDRGDMFGEIALLSPTRRRQATVTALTPLHVLSLTSAAFEKALRACPDARIDIGAVADTLLTAKFLKQRATWRR